MNTQFLQCINIIELLLLFIIGRLMTILETIHNSKF